MGTGIEMCFMGTNEGQLLRTMGPKPQWMEQMKGALSEIHFGALVRWILPQTLLC